MTNHARLKRILTAVLAAALLFAAACAETTDDGDTLAILNGEAITRAEVNEAFAYYDENYGDDYSAAELWQAALGSAVTMRLMTQKGTEAGILPLTEEELRQAETDARAEWAEIVDSYIDYYGGLGENATEEEKLAARTNILAMLEGMGWNEDLWVQDTLDNAGYLRVETYMERDATVTDLAVETAFAERVETDRAAYGNNISDYEFMTRYYGEESLYTPEGYRGVLQILLAVDDGLLASWTDLSEQLEAQDASADGAAVTQADVDAAYAAAMASVRPTIDEIYARLEQGASFTDLIDEYNTDPGMRSEPYRSEGYAVHRDSIFCDPALVRAAFSAEKIGDVGEPVLGSSGVYIVCYLRDIPGGAAELTDEKRAELREELLDEAKSDAYQATLDAWMEEAALAYVGDGIAMEAGTYPADGADRAE